LLPGGSDARRKALPSGHPPSGRGLPGTWWNSPAWRPPVVLVREKKRLGRIAALPAQGPCQAQQQLHELSSVQADVLMGAVEGKGGNPDPETLAVVVLHFVAALHDATRCRQGAAAGVDEACAWRQHRLFAHDARALDLLGQALGVGDPPIAVEQ